jgi:hypothetical protein
MDKIVKKVSAIQNFHPTFKAFFRQPSHRKRIILRLTEVAIVGHSISPKADKSENIFGNCYSVF